MAILRYYVSLLVFVVAIVAPAVVGAQEIEVVSLEETHYVLAGDMLRNDLNGNPCALLKVQLPIEGAVFDGDIIGDVKYDVNEYLIYVVEGTKMLEIKCPGHYGKMINLRDYGVNGVKAKRIYELKLKGQSPAQTVVSQRPGSVTFKCNVDGAEVLFGDEGSYNSVGYTTQKQLSALWPQGQTIHYTVRKSGYDDVTGTVTVAESITVTVTMEKTKVAYSPVAVDLGLSVKWASVNIGAEKPSDYGSYFAWGETTTKKSYTPKNSLWYGIKYVELQKKGVIDSKGNLTSQYDAATVLWGAPWRMPTYNEIKELRDKCKWISTKENGQIGYRVTGPNGNSIFLPVAGYKRSSDINNTGSYGYYWSASGYSYVFSAYDLDFNPSDHNSNNYNRYYGLSIRPVTE